MNPKRKNRLILLIVSFAIMLVLFFLNVRGSSENQLPPTPTRVTSSAIAAMDTITPFPTATATVPHTPTPNLDLTNEAEERANTAEADAQTATVEAGWIQTAEAGLTLATQRARAMHNIIKVLKEDGSVQTVDGSYKTSEDFGASFDRTGYYQMWYSEFEARYFVIRANIFWNNAGEEVSFPLAGCGIVFGFQDLSNHHRVFLNLDGSVKTHRMQDGDFSIISIDNYGSLEQPAGHANIILAVDEGLLSVYINNQLITRLNEDVLEGKLAYAVASGSSIDFGTSCEFKDIELWILE